MQTQAISITIDHLGLAGDLRIPENASGLVVFAHGSGSNRRSPRNRYVAQALEQGGLATLQFDLLTPDEARIDEMTRELRFDPVLLGDRLGAATDWMRHERRFEPLPIGYFGASTGAAAAIRAATGRPGVVRAVVSRGGRPDLAGAALRTIETPTLLIVGGADTEVIELNARAFRGMRGVKEKEMVIIPGATHLFPEAGAMEEVTRLTRDWFTRHLATVPVSGAIW
ncbi:MAG TPA: dienelactone hydrolase family protein [Gemmatimonadaceae bacterium]|nr:dienelactone hydrolase family protein [Gemmatimonadaceae bacterium]